MKKRNCVWLLCIIQGFVAVMNAQVLKVEGGMAFSNLRTSGLERNQLFNKFVIPFQGSIGIEYLDKKNFNLSSSIGYLRMGGKEKIYQYNGPDPANASLVDQKYFIDYLTINTLFNLKRSVHRLTYYLGVGPRVDFKTGVREAGVESMEYIDGKQPEVNSAVFGLKCEAGIWYALDDRFRLGANIGYLPSFTKAWISPVVSDITMATRAFTLGLTLGYALK
ncbi:MAG: PorT family protein [Parabacteroides sp.]|nr:PorT family protein [Parabacteroides sp.]